MGEALLSIRSNNPLVVNGTITKDILLDENLNPYDAIISIAQEVKNQSLNTILSAPATLPNSTSRAQAWSLDETLLVISQSASPFIAIYQREGATLTKLPNPSILPSGAIRECAFSPDGSILAVSHEYSPFITLYQISGTTFTKLPNPSILPTGDPLSCSWSPDGSMLAVGHMVFPFVTIYQRNNTVFTKLPNLPGISIFPVMIARCSFSPNGQFLAVGGDQYTNQSGVIIYQVSGTTFTQLQTISLESDPLVVGNFSWSPLGNILVIIIASYRNQLTYKISGTIFTKMSNPLPRDSEIGSWTPDGKLFAITHYDSPYLSLYSVQGTTFTKLANPSTLPPGSGQGCSFSLSGQMLSVTHANSPYFTVYTTIKDNIYNQLANPGFDIANSGRVQAWSSGDKYLALGSHISPFLEIYKREGSSFNKLSTITVPPEEQITKCDFSPDGNLLAMSLYNSPFIAIYQRNGDIFTKLPNPSILPVTYYARSCAFSPNGQFFAIVNGASPFLIIYQVSGTTFTKLPDPAFLPPGTGHSCSWSPDGSMLAVGCSSSPFLIIYQVSGTTFTKLPGPTEIPPSVGNSVGFSPNGEFLFVKSSFDLLIYKISGTTFTKLPSPAILPGTASTADGCSWSPDSNFLLIITSGSPMFSMYQRIGSSFIPLKKPTTSPGNLSGIMGSFSNNGRFLATGTGTGGVKVYEIDQKIIKSNKFIPALQRGYIETSGTMGEIKAIKLTHY